MCEVGFYMRTTRSPAKEELLGQPPAQTRMKEIKRNRPFHYHLDVCGGETLDSQLQ